MLKSAVIEEKKLKHSPWEGADNPLGPNFDVNRKPSSLWSFVASLKRISSTSDFIHIFSWFNKCIYSRKSGADNPQRTKFWCQQKPLATLVICYKCKKKSLWNLILCNFFHDFIHVYSPGAGADNPLGTKFWCQQEHLVTLVICCKLKKNLFEVWFYTFFFMDLIHVYSPGAGAESPQGTKFWCQQKGLITLPICCNFQRNLFEVWFYAIFFLI